MEWTIQELGALGEFIDAIEAIPPSTMATLSIGTKATA